MSACTRKTTSIFTTRRPLLVALMRRTTYKRRPTTDDVCDVLTASSTTTQSPNATSAPIFPPVTVRIGGMAQDGAPASVDAAYPTWVPCAPGSPNSRQAASRCSSQPSNTSASPRTVSLLNGSCDQPVPHQPPVHEPPRCRRGDQGQTRAIRWFERRASRLRSRKSQ